LDFRRKSCQTSGQTAGNATTTMTACDGAVGVGARIDLGTTNDEEADRKMFFGEHAIEICTLKISADTVYSLLELYL